MSTTSKSGKHGQGVGCGISSGESPSPSPLAGPGPGGHKPSFRSTKLARRARSFKEDFLEKISQMRSPPGSGTVLVGGVGRPHSPRTPIRGLHATTQPSDTKSPTKDIELMVRQVEVALKHFRDVIAKDKLEMLPGNGTIVLDTIQSILSVMKPLVDSESSAAVGSATHHVYQSLGRLLKLCDDVLLHGRQSSSLAQDNVAEVVSLLEAAVQEYVQVARDKLSHKPAISGTTTNRNTCLELPAQRNSLPDIPLTPRERQTLEQKSVCGGSGSGSISTVRSSHSTESVLRPDSPVPPPKPPLPAELLCSVCVPETDSTSLGTPPPLPPKKRSHRAHQLIGECCTSDSSLLGCSFDRMSFRSRSPEDSSSLLSASAGSLDSVLNHSREEDEIRALMEHVHNEDGERENDISDVTYIVNHGSNGSYSYDDAFCTSNTLTSLNHISDMQPTFDVNRLSNTDSGFASMQSHRNSVQSYSTSKRSSQQSSSSQWSSQQKLLSNSLYSQHTENSIQNVSSVHTSEGAFSTCQTGILESFSLVEKSVTNTTASFSQHSSLSSSQMSDLSLVQPMIADSNDVVDLDANDDTPPAIPQKTRSRHGRHERQPSPYDNVPVNNMSGELIPCLVHQSQNENPKISTDSEDSKPPPLPAKKRHIMAYMEMFGNCSHSNDNEFMRHSMHMVQTQWQNHQQQSLDSGLSSTQSCSFVHTTNITHHTLTPLPSVNFDQKINHTSPSRSPNSVSPNSKSNLPPALPPKRSRASSTKSNTSPPPPPVSPNILTYNDSNLEMNHSDHSCDKISSNNNNNNKEGTECNSPLSTSTPTPLISHKVSSNELNKISENSELSMENDVDLMDEIDVNKYIILKKPEEDGPDIRGGYIDALIVQATKTNKKDFSYQEAFLTTYRTFISPYNLITKLIRRHQYFICQPERKPRAREAFSLLVRVVKDLTVSDLEEILMQIIMDFIHQLVCSGNLVVAKVLRVALIEKYNAKLLQSKLLNTQASLSLVAASAILLDFKSEQIAEQMTLLDANLFIKIEIPEVLIWAQEQNEERSPNLTRFTEHFNKMSYWARTKILQSDAKDREKYVMKFIKIMKHLRKINNFNSYLALLSALDSAPIRRLEWQKHITEGLKEYCALIDSSSSFRAYRQALAETSPPCIPYIGLVLQDLTFVHIGNSNLLPDGTINFSKRWQQYNIVENMKRFKKCTYTFKKNERIIAFFRNFDDFIGEDAMWQISESIKPRGGKKTT